MEFLKDVRHVLAPMVDQSELAWRILARRHGAHLCYTPMLHARIFLESAAYRSTHFTTNGQDRPLVAQFCGNDAQTLLEAARLVEDRVDAVDLNLGCPQGIAKKGHYGSYLQDEWELVGKIVKGLKAGLRVPVTCKIRIFSDPNRTLEYAKMLEAAGADLLTVHGRTREQRGSLTGLADWQQIRRIVETVHVPVFANGNILGYDDIAECLRVTGAAGVMSAEGHLSNPCIFEGRTAPRVADVVREYLQICGEVATPPAFIRAHLFKLYRAIIPRWEELRNRLATARTMDELGNVAEAINCRLAQAQANGESEMLWTCQPYLRPRQPNNKCSGCGEADALKECEHRSCGNCCARAESTCVGHDERTVKRTRVAA